MLGYAASFVFLSAVMGSEAADNLRAFPPAGEGVTRLVLTVPKQADESAFKVELIVGKTVKVDDVNTFFFSGNIEEEVVEGWGFPKFVVRRLGTMGS